MTPQQLANEINSQVEKAEPQSEDNLETLYLHYCELFVRMCGELPVFEMDNKGRITLV